MSGPLRARASLVTAAAMGLLLVVNVSSAASGVGVQGFASVGTTASAAGHTVESVTDRGWGTERPAPGSASATVTASSSAASAGSSASAATASTAKAAASRSTSAAAVNAATATTPPAFSGWKVDWSDNFTTPLEASKWARYGYGGQAPGQGGMGVYQQSNAFTSNGNLVLRTQYENGAWSSAGLSSGDFYSASGGRWEIRAKFPVAKGIGYVFLLWPDDGTWPPEIDLAEGRVKGPQVMSTYHWGAANNRDSQFLNNSTMSAWQAARSAGSSCVSFMFPSITIVSESARGLPKEFFRK